MDSCTSCALTARRDAGEAPGWDEIVRTPGWDVVHADHTGLEGWMVLTLRRHAPALADLTGAEAAELGPLIADVSRALGDVVGCAKTYVAQFAEAEGHQHVHVHVVPRAPDLAPEYRGPRIFALLVVPPEDEVPEARRNEIAAALRRRLDPAGR